MTTERHYQRGELLLGSRYRVLRLLGSGGMGSVYDVEHVELGKRFVLKLLLPEFSSRSDLVQRLRNEWRALGRLEHPNIVNVTDAGVTSDGQPYYVMERLDGETLARRLSHSPRMQVPDALAVTCQLLDGLAAAHDIGVVHRDIKPPNIFLLSDGGLKLLDFGIAKILDGEPGIVTARGLAIGTPRFMAPEQARGDRIDGRADLYAVGLLLFEMIAGVGPFEHLSDQNQLVLAHINQPAPRLSARAPGIAAALDDMVASLLAKDPRDRPGHARGVAAVLRALAERYAALSGSPDVSTVVADYHGVTLGVSGESTTTLVDSATHAVPSSAVLPRPQYGDRQPESSQGGVTVSDGELSGGDTLLGEPPSSAAPIGDRTGFSGSAGDQGGDTLNLSPTPLPRGAAEPTRTAILSPSASGSERAIAPVARDPAGNLTPPPVEQGLADGQRVRERRSYTRLIAVGLVALAVGAASAVFVKRLPGSSEAGRAHTVEPVSSAAGFELPAARPANADPASQTSGAVESEAPDRALGSAPSHLPGRGAAPSGSEARSPDEEGLAEDSAPAPEGAFRARLESLGTSLRPSPAKPEPKASDEPTAAAAADGAAAARTSVEPRRAGAAGSSRPESKKKNPSEGVTEEAPAERRLPASGL